MKIYKYNIGRQNNCKPIVYVFVVFMAVVSCRDDFHKQQPDFPFAINSLSRTDSNSLHFFVLSDWGFNGSFGQKDVAAEMALISKYVGLDFILTCGDNFQYAGVGSVADSLWVKNYVNVYGDSSLQVPWYPALGNHDYFGSADAQVAYSTLNENWKMPSRYYAFTQRIDAGCFARFLVIDTQDLINSYRRLSDATRLDSISQYLWLKSQLSESTEKWVFVVGHHPVYSASSVCGDTEELKLFVKPLLDQYKVDFYLCGHDHNFEHAKDKSEHTDYIVLGTGALPRAADWNERTVYAMSALGFCYFSVATDTAKLYFVMADGKIGYSFIKAKSTPN